MAKGSSIFGGKSSSTHNDLHEPAQGVNLARMSTSSSLFSLRRLDSARDDRQPQFDRQSMRPPSIQTVASVAGSSPTGNPPLLTLKFTGPSLLDVVAKDNITKDPVYIIETIRDTTTVYRLDHHLRQAIKTATVQWPQSLIKGKSSGRTVQIGSGRWRDTEEFLKYGALANFAIRKFNIPHFPHALKWKMVPGNSYFCSTSGIKGPIAVLDAAVLSAPPRLRVFQTFLNGDAERTQENIKGVPVLLLDYLITTALILVTEVQEWLDRPHNESGRVRIPGSSAPAIQKWLAIIHNEPIPMSPPMSPSADAQSLWDVRSRISGTTSVADSNSSGDLYTPITPATPSMSFMTSRNEDIPPVPPLPPLPPAVRPATQRPPSHPYASSYVNNSSDNLAAQAAYPSPSSSSSSAMSPPAAMSMSSRPTARPLPTPPGQSVPSAPRPWTSDGRVSSPLNPTFERPASPASSTSSNSLSHRSRGARSSLSRSVSIPPQQPPPHQNLPLPPKLAEEYSRMHQSSQAYSGGGESSSSTLQPANPDLPIPSIEPRVHQITTEMQLMGLRSPPLHSGTSMYHQPILSPAHAQPMADAGMLSLAQAPGGSRSSYAETIYDMPPPAYDAIDFSLPQVQLPQR